MNINELWMISLYVGPAALLMGMVAMRRGGQHRRSHRAQREMENSGLVEPASLHPVIDPLKCVGCGSCVVACPEGNVLGVISGKAALINPSHCIGHGACKTACPMDAIRLVFGSETRGVDIPHVKPNFESNVPGLFIAGELGGMGLIRNAIEQGRQAMEAVHKKLATRKDDTLDVVIVGAGPAGIAATLSAMERGLRHITLEQDSLGGTVAHFPRGKLVMTAPVQLPLVGKVKFTETTKEALLGFWEKIISDHGVVIQFQQAVQDIVADQCGFIVKTAKGDYRTRAVLLAIGRRGTPRTLGVPGEDLPKVVYRLIDAQQYREQQVLVVGGGDSALEAATSIAEQSGTRVTLSYRSQSFSRAKEKNRDKVSAAEAAGRLQVLFNSEVKEIHRDQVLVEQDGNLLTLANDAVIISAGGLLPTPFLKKIGIDVETKYGTE